MYFNKNETWEIHDNPLETTEHKYLMTPINNQGQALICIRKYFIKPQLTCSPGGEGANSSG